LNSTELIPVTDLRWYSFCDNVTEQNTIIHNTMLMTFFIEDNSQTFLHELCSRFKRIRTVIFFMLMSTLFYIRNIVYRSHQRESYILHTRNFYWRFHYDSEDISL
jgi:hypothetical protein